MIISLKEFVCTGQFGPVSIGSTRQEVVEVLGMPGDEARFGAGSGGLFYEGFEFFYFIDNQQVFTIQNDNIPALQLYAEDKTLYRLNDQAMIDVSWLLKAGVPAYKNILDLLEQEQLSFKKIVKNGYDELRMESGVAFDFENWEIAEKNQQPIDQLRLNGIRYTRL